MQPDPTLLSDIVQKEMPFGKYKGRKIYQLPVHYLEWFERNGFPKGRLGEMLSTLYIIKTNGLQDILQKVIELHRKP
jgi:hypothetical protein